MRRYDVVVVGAGLAGGILARKLAEERNQQVLIVERRNHIAGNTYDYTDEHGVKVQKYGPHVLHTNSERAYAFIAQFCEPVEYRTRCEAVIDGISTPSPFNFKTVDQFYPPEEAATLKRKLAESYPGRPSVTVVEMLESADEDVNGFARFLFEKDYRPYTAKQWSLDPSEIDPSVLKRVPIVLSYGDTYFYDKYEFMPRNGFQEMYRRIIDYPNIDVRLGVDALEHLTLDDKARLTTFDGEAAKVIYTGAIDELFGYRYGVLPYRSLLFDFRSEPRNSFQSAAIVAYPQEKGYTRITEYTKMPFQDCGGWTCVAYEYPVPYDREAEVGNEPYYPVLTQQSQRMYEAYKAYANTFTNLYLCGRLAEYKYYNMDQVILRALEVYDTIKEEF